MQAKENKFKILLLLLYFIVACTNKTNQETYIVTRDVCKDIVIEVYQTYSGGVFAGDSYSHYITDSSNFKLFLGKYDDDCNYDYTCYKDKVIIIKECKNPMRYEVVDSKVYEIEKLKKMNNYNKKD